LPLLKLVIFDCDGVMFDSKAANREYYNHILARFGHPPMSAAEVEYVHMHHVMDSVRHIFRRYPEDLEGADHYRRTVDYQPFLKHMLLEPDLREFLDLLPSGCGAAISTNRTTTMSTILKVFDLKKYFGMVVTAMDVKHPKPHPEALHVILNHFRCSVEEAVYIGDSQVDRDHTASIGMRLIAYKNPALPAEYHVRSFLEITTLPFWPGAVCHRQAAV
jgi:phosphoglycolate phosphatase